MTECSAVQLYCQEQSTLSGTGPRPRMLDMLNLLTCVALICFVALVSSYVAVRAAVLESVLAFFLRRLLRRSNDTSLPAGELSVEQFNRGGALGPLLVAT